MIRRVSAARALLAHLRRGGLIAYATAGSFGLGCLPQHPQALRRLVRLKRRPLHKGLIVVADRLERLQRFMAPLASAQQAQLRARWPGHWTWLVPASRRVPALLRGRSRKIALRVDPYPSVKALCAALRVPLVSTSANRSGRRALRSARAVQRQFGGQVKVLNGRCKRGARASTIADLLSGRILRPG